MFGPSVVRNGFIPRQKTSDTPLFFFIFINLMLVYSVIIHVERNLIIPISIFEIVWRSGRAPVFGATQLLNPVLYYKENMSR